MAKEQLPRFVIYQPNQKEFHICLQVGDKFFCWLSNYPPTLDVRFQREIKRIEDIPANKISRQRVFDQGTYATTKSDTKETAEKKMVEGIKGKSFPFILNGKKLKGRFALKKLASGTVIQKYKDKYAVEEDVLSGDLSRTISTMIPDYNEKKVQLNYPKKPNKQKIEEPEEEQPLEKVTQDKTIGNTTYHFAIYTSSNEPDVCLITSVEGDVLVLIKERNKWVLSPSASKSALKREKEFIEHSKALDSQKLR